MSFIIAAVRARVDCAAGLAPGPPAQRAVSAGPGAPFAPTGEEEVK
jgi:hypothetical protein